MVRFGGLTSQEKKVLGFLIFLTLLGAGVLAVRALFGDEQASSPSPAVNIIPTHVERNSP